MKKEIVVEALPEVASSAAMLKKIAASQSGLPADRISAVIISKRSIDARRVPVKFRLMLDVYVDELPPSLLLYPMERNVSNAREVHIVGMGPAGIFCALKCIEHGIKPVIFERGKDIRARRRDLAKLTREHIVNEESNYCFGEGGAGTYSDGKLYTRSYKRGDVRGALETFVAFGASEDILVDAHPHIGTNKLPGIIQLMRQHILQCGGEVHFEHKLNDISFDAKGVKSITVNDQKIDTHNVVLATGHSARDVFELLHQKGIRIEAKPFALGVRIEHPQHVIDKIQYHCDTRNPNLPPAAYSLVNQFNEKGTFSFCMCPGGIIAPCATKPGEIVTNGWSPSKRDNPYANSGIVTEVSMKDVHEAKLKGPLAAMLFQQHVEREAYKAGGGGQTAPAQRLIDFLEGKVSAHIPANSYLPGTRSTDLREVLPPFVSNGLKHAFLAFGRKMKGYIHEEAVILATESRTSSPVRVPRDKSSFQHTEISGLYPCGEGAGYAGGIISAAIDGERVAAAIAQKINASS